MRAFNGVAQVRRGHTIDVVRANAGTQIHRRSFFGNVWRQRDLTISAWGYGFRVRRNDG
jgi:hypothetical protein